MPAIASADRRSAPVRTRAVPPATSPAGSAVTSRPTASAISRRLTSLRIRAAGLTSTTVSGSATPRIVTRVTPAAKRRAVNSSANRPSCSASTGPEITTSVTRSRQMPRRTCGSSAASGSSPIPSTAACTSASARAMSQPGSKSTAIRALPSEEVASVASTPSTPTIAGSRSCTIARSTSSAPAPSQVTETSTCSTITSGKNCARIRGTAAIPAASSTTSSRFAAVRCRAK